MPLAHARPYAGGSRPSWRRGRQLRHVARAAGRDEAEWPPDGDGAARLSRGGAARMAACCSPATPPASTTRSPARGSTPRCAPRSCSPRWRTPRSQRRRVRARPRALRAGPPPRVRGQGARHPRAAARHRPPRAGQPRRALPGAAQGSSAASWASSATSSPHANCSAPRSPGAEADRDDSERRHRPGHLGAPLAAHQATGSARVRRGPATPGASPPPAPRASPTGTRSARDAERYAGRRARFFGAAGAAGSAAAG